MFVATPPGVCETLRTSLSIPRHGYVLDPCCGAGDALAQLAPDSCRYGVELDGERAGQAAARMTEVLPCAMQDAKVSHEAFGLLLLNPPYSDSTEGRLESVFLDRTTKYLEPGGILVLIIKESLYSVVVGTLRRYYDIIGHWRFPVGWYDGPHLGFGQTVLIARKRPNIILRMPDEFWKNDLRMGSLEHLPDGPVFDTPIEVPFGHKPRCFVSGSMRPEDVIKLLASSPVPRRMRVPGALGCGRPLLPLKQGHLSMTLAAGFVNGVYGQGDSLHVAKGTVVRVMKEEYHTDRTAAGAPVVLKKETDSFAIKVRALQPSGKVWDMITAGVAEVEEENDDDDAADR